MSITPQRGLRALSTPQPHSAPDLLSVSGDRLFCSFSSLEKVVRSAEQVAVDTPWGSRGGGGGGGGALG